MKYTGFIVLFLLTGVCLQTAIAQVVKPDSTHIIVPLIHWKPRQIDVGKVPYGKPVSRDFTVENHSDSILLITNVRTGCHCTTATWTMEPIEPGAQGVLHVTYDAMKEDEFYKVIIVFTNQDVEQPMGLIFKGKVGKNPQKE